MHKKQVPKLHYYVKLCEPYRLLLDALTSVKHNKKVLHRAHLFHGTCACNPPTNT